MNFSDKYIKATELIDAVNKQDPNKEIVDGQEVPKEYIYSQRMTQKMEDFAEVVTEEALIAARGHHISRWEVPRSSYPAGKKGYYEWRTGLYVYHADRTGEIMEEAGYGAESIALVKKMIGKKDLKNDADCQLLEDVICLVFIEYYLAEFADKYEDKDKLPNIIKKTWAKMSDRAHEAALKLNLSEELFDAIKKALGL